MVLDSSKQIQKLNSLAVLESIRLLPEQCTQAFWESGKVVIPKSYKEINNIVINGMGGSGLSAHVLKSVYSGRIKLPLEVINNYHLPGYVSSRTLYIASSYSGTTEEIIISLKEAKSKKAKIMGITTGGQLAAFLKKNKLPAYIYQPQFNPSGQPRMGGGYSLIGQLVLLDKLGIIEFTKGDLEKIIKVLENAKSKYDFKIQKSKNIAKQTAARLKNKIPIIISCQSLAGNDHTLANQINETAKNFSCYFLIPELNHHLLEGLIRPISNRKNLSFVFLEAKSYLPRNQKRIRITKQVLKKNKIDFVSFKTNQASKILESFETLSFGSYLSFYLSLQNSVNPQEVPFVKYFKKQLK